MTSSRTTRPKGLLRKIPVSEWIAISTPKEQRRCTICDGQIEERLAFKINAHDSGFYVWAHIKCMYNLAPRGPAYLTNFGCSVCGKKADWIEMSSSQSDNELFDYGHFRLHDKCLIELKEKINKILEEEGPMLALYLL